MTKLTVSAKVLLKMAANYEKSAHDNHNAWILVGNYDSFGKYMSLAATLRRAAAEKSIWVRREILRNNGITA